ncbi:MAG: hypothetical protein QOH04_1411 [Sphingomonadales bacterium]|nr:hypothetical protein [Sphingomonadales bacterium]
MLLSENPATGAIGAVSVVVGVKDIWFGELWEWVACPDS